MMEVNKDEAERCIEFAERFILEGRKDKAEKFLLKAERLFPTQKAKGKPRLPNYSVCIQHN
jgi:DnaJ family protein B protein 12